MKPKTLLCSALLMLFLSTPVAAEKTVGNSVALHPELAHSLNGERLYLSGHVRYRYWGFAVYDVALYTARGVTPHTLYDHPGALVLHYKRALAKEDFSRAAEAILTSHDTELFSRLQPTLAQWDRLLAPVQVGDQYAMFFAPDGTLALTLNGTLKGTVRNEEFKRAYLGIWLGDYSVLGSERLRLFAHLRQSTHNDPSFPQGAS
ncbi:MAG: chalcone isomerase family protein [Bdellovibrionota bacterium]|nr:MAG: chalcone isomerase family protein [Bdellovibrionota bacterium]